MIRLNKYIATCGVCSRRSADELIVSGKVKVNGIVVKEMGMQVDETEDIVCVNGKRVSIKDEKVYIMLNKPKGYVTTNSEQFNRPSTNDLIKEKIRVFPIGRLDMNTEGLLLLTNDGDFANKLMHPSNKIEKTYIVTLRKQVTDEQINMLQNGVDIGDYITRPAKVKRINLLELEIKISEGKNRQIRRMCEAVGADLKNLKRVQVGNLKLGDLKLGKYRFLSLDEISNI